MNDYEAPPNQKLNTTSSPTFAGLTINGTATFASTVTVTTSIASPLYTSGAGTDIALSPGDNASATDTAGAALNLRSGKGRGAGAASSIVFQTPTVGSTGTTLQTLATRLTVATAGITATVPVLAPNGSAAAPSLSFSADAATGILLAAASTMDLTVAGTVRVRVSNASVPLSVRTGLGLGATATSVDTFLTYHSTANLRQGAAAANDADGVAQTLRSPGGGTVSSGTTGRNGGAYTITAGNGSDAKSGSNANGGNGGILTLTGGAKGLKDGSGTDGLDGGVQVSRTGGLLGFYGVSPIARAVLATGAGATVDNVITALQNLGLVSQS